MADRQILATSGGLLPSDRHGTSVFGPLLRHALSLTGAERPRISFVLTAVGDSDSALRAYYGAAAYEEVDASHLALFPMPNVRDVRAHVLAQDAIWVGGGSVANLLSLWRLHGLDVILRQAWEAGIVLAGSSAGSICWHVGGTTDSFGPELRPVTDGLGFLPYGNGVHHDQEERRRPLLLELVGRGTLPVSYATDDGVGLHYVGTELHEAVAEREGPSAWRIEPDGRGGAREVALPPRPLP